MTTDQYHNLLEKDISTTVGLGVLSEAEQETYIEQIGETILDAALLRLVVGLSDEQATALNYYLETEPPLEVLLQHLSEHYPDFEAILIEEIVAFKEETVALFGGIEADTGIPASTSIE
jgi:hypothetical protein